MRADRLLSMLMLLQTRGRMTARELARELEVSERTIYRDVDALSTAGVPVYGEAGPDGGYALLDGYRSDLTGLTEGERRALFLLSLLAPSGDLGVGQEIKAALLKLSAALPGAHQRDEQKMRQRFHLDSSGWRQGGERVPHLQTIFEALQQDHKLEMTYRLPFGLEFEQTVDPYGLVVKAGVWYLVLSRKGKVHVHKVSDLTAVRMSEVPFERLSGFDLAQFWTAWCAEHEAVLVHFTATVRVVPSLVPLLAHHLGSHLDSESAQAGPPDAKGWIRLELSFESLEEARERLLGLGRGVEVLAPRALRRSILDYAEQIVDLYTGGSAM
jgi:predicted DNA-binding transcriptional regulator YafY